MYHLPALVVADGKDGDGTSLEKLKYISKYMYRHIYINIDR